jgi:hypothetical protein
VLKRVGYAHGDLVRLTPVYAAGGALEIACANGFHVLVYVAVGFLGAVFLGLARMVLG